MVPIHKLHKLPSNLGPQGEPFFVAKAKPRGTIELWMLLFVYLIFAQVVVLKLWFSLLVLDLGGFK